MILHNTFLQQEIDLSTWTAYTSYLENHKAVTEPDVFLLVEARRLEDLEKLAESSLRIPPAYRVHVSECRKIVLKTPAWSSISVGITSCVIECLSAAVGLLCEDCDNK